MLIPTLSDWSFDHPWQALRRLQDQLDRVTTGDWTSYASAFPALSLWVKEDAAQVVAELPGVDASALDISCENDQLVIRGERRAPAATDEEHWHRREREAGAFARSLRLPFRIDPDKTAARYADGILTVSVERAAEDRPRKITVKS